MAGSRVPWRAVLCLPSHAYASTAYAHVLPTLKHARMQTHQRAVGMRAHALKCSKATLSTHSCSYQVIPLFRFLYAPVPAAVSVPEFDCCDLVHDAPFGRVEADACHAARMHRNLNVERVLARNM